MEEIGILTLLILVANGLMTYKGLNDRVFLEKYSFNVGNIISDKAYKTLITSGFLHVNWSHFLFNMITLYLFSSGLEAVIGIPSFFLIYFGSLVGGNLLALYIHRNHLDYSAVGASGAVSGLIFASIALFPGIEIGFILLPIAIPGWIFGLAYVIYSIYGIKSQSDNIGHEAHLGGGILGLVIAVVLYPHLLSTNTLPIALILLPSLVFLIAIIKKPHLLIISNPFLKKSNNQSLEDRYNAKKVDKQSEIDKLLDKINKNGYENLSEKDRERLKKLTK